MHKIEFKKEPLNTFLEKNKLKLMYSLNTIHMDKIFRFSQQSMNCSISDITLEKSIGSVNSDAGFERFEDAYFAALNYFYKKNNNVLDNLKKEKNISTKQDQLSDFSKGQYVIGSSYDSIENKIKNCVNSINLIKKYLNSPAPQENNFSGTILNLINSNGIVHYHTIIPNDHKVYLINDFDFNRDDFLDIRCVPIIKTEYYIYNQTVTSPLSPLFYRKRTDNLFFNSTYFIDDLNYFILNGNNLINFEEGFFISNSNLRCFIDLESAQKHRELILNKIKSKIL